MGCILLKRAGLIVPQAQIELIIGNNARTFGAALLDADKNLAIESGISDQTVPASEVMKTMEDFKDRDVLFHFGSELTPVHEDVQPYTLIDSPTGPLLLGMFVGNFDGLKKQNSSFGGAYFAAQEVQSKLLPLFKFSKGSLDKVLDHIRSDPDWKDETEALYAKEGNITLFAKTGEIISFNTMESHSKDTFPWGWTTDTHGYTEAAAAPKKTGMFAGLRSTKMSVPAVKVDKTDPKVDEPVVDPNTDEPEVQDTGPMTDPKFPNALFKMDAGKKYVRANHKLNLSNSRKQELYDTLAEETPKRFKDCPWVLAKDSVVLKSFQQLDKDMAAANSTAVVTPARAESTVVNLPKKLIASTEPAKNPVEEGNKRGLISPNQKKGIEDYLKNGEVIKAIDLHSKMLAEKPEQMQAQEAKLGNFAQSTGISLEETLRWPFSVRLDICKKEPIYGAVAWKDLNNLYVETLRELAEAELQIEQLTAPTAKAEVVVEKKAGAFAGLRKKTA